MKLHCMGRYTALMLRSAALTGRASPVGKLHYGQLQGFKLHFRYRSSFNINFVTRNSVSRCYSAQGSLAQHYASLARAGRQYNRSLPSEAACPNVKPPYSVSYEVKVHWPVQPVVVIQLCFSNEQVLMLASIGQIVQHMISNNCDVSQFLVVVL